MAERGRESGEDCLIGKTVFGAWLLLFSSVSFACINQSGITGETAPSCFYELAQPPVRAFFFMAARVKIEMEFPQQTATAAAAAAATAATALTISCLSEIIAPNVIDITGPISGETNMAATIFGALFSTSPSAARELQGESRGEIVGMQFALNVFAVLTRRSQLAADSRKTRSPRRELRPPPASRSVSI